MAIDETLNLNSEPYVSGIDNSVSALDRLEKKQNEVEQSSQKMSDSLRKSFESAQPGEMSQSEVDKLFPSDPAQKYGGQISDLVGKVTGLSVASLGLVAAGTAVAGVLKESVSSAADYQTSITDIANNTGQGVEGLEGLKAAVEGSSVSQNEAAQAGVQLSETFKDNTQIVNAFTGAMLLSESTHMQLGTAVSLTSEVLTKYNIDTTKSSEVANMFVAGAQKSKTSVTDLASAVAGAGPMATALGMDITETTAVMMAFSDSGIKGGAATNAFTLGMRGLMKDNKGVTDTLSEMGLKFSDINPTMHSFDDITSTLAEHHMTLTQSFALFGRAGAPIFNMIEDGGKKMNGYKEAVTGTTAAEDAAARNDKTYNEAMETLSASFVAAENDLGTLLLPALADFVTVVAQGITGATKLGEAIYNLGGSSAQNFVNFMNSDTIGGKVKGFMQWGDTMLGNDPNASYSKGSSTGASYNAGLTDTIQSLDMSKMVSDTFAESDNVARQAGTLTGKAFDDAVKAEMDRGASKVMAEVKVAFANEFGNLSDWSAYEILNKMQSQAENGPRSQILGAVKIGGFDVRFGDIEENEGYWKYTLYMPDGTQMTLDKKDPAADAIQKLQNYLKRSLTDLEKAELTDPALAIKMKMQGVVEYSFTFDKEKAADNLRQQLSDSINDAIKAGTVDVTKTTDFMDLYHKALKLDPASVKDYSNEVINQLDNSLRGLKKWEEQLKTLQTEGEKTWGDSYEGLISITQKNIETSKNEIKGYMEDLKESTEFKPIILDQKLFNESEWKDAGTKIGSALANGAVDSFEEKATLTALKDKFVQEGDKARADFMDHVINGDWSIPQLQAKAAELGMAFSVGFKKNLDLFGNAIPDALKGFDLAAYLKTGVGENMISNTKDFVENVFQPALKDSVDKMDIELSKGMVETLQPASDLIDNLMLKASQRPDMFSFEELRTLEAYRAGIISLQEAFDRLDGKGDKWISNLDNRMAVFQKHQVAFDMYYGLNKNTDVSAQGQTPSPGIQGYKYGNNGDIESYSQNFFYGQKPPTSPVPVNIVSDSSGASPDRTTTRNQITQPSSGAGGTSNPLTQTGFNSQMSTVQTAITTGLTTLNSSVQLIENTGISNTLIKGMAKSVTDIGTAQTKEFTDLKTALSTDTSTITSTISKAISDAAGAIIKDAREGRAKNNGGGSEFDFSSFDNAFSNFSVFGSGGEPGVGSNFSVFASGGDFITNGPRVIGVGEAGPERVTITPLSEARASANLGLNIETSAASRQLSDIIMRIENSTPTLRLQVQLDVESYYFQTMIENAVKLAVQNVKVR